MTGRFAPTPSGRMHVGNVYAMLAAWLDARSRGERMLLRIEDIDTPRVLPDADRWIMDDLHWLGLDWDGEPVYQSQRGELYVEALRVLEPQLFPCFCSRADLRAASAPQEGDGYQLYPGTCRRLSVEHPNEVSRCLAAGRQHSLRLAVSTSISSTVPSHPQSADADSPRPSGGQGKQTWPPLGRGLSAKPTGGGATANCFHTSQSSGTSSGTTPQSPPPALSSLPEVLATPCHSERRPQAEVIPCHPERSAERGAEGSSSVRFIDQVFGNCSYDLARDIGDAVMRRADGVVSYQLAVTVDDLAQGVTSVVRGRDLLRSTALQLHIRQLLLRGGFGSVPESGLVPESGTAPTWPEPSELSFAHLPLIDNAAGRRLAKRERSLDMGALRSRGVTAEHVIGYCAWLLRLIPEPTPCRAADLVSGFSWVPLRADHIDRRLDPTDPAMPQWLAEAL